MPEDVDRTASYHSNMVAEHGEDPQDEPALSSINQKLDALTLLVQQQVNRKHTTRTSVAKADLQQPADEQVTTDLDENLRGNKFVQGKCTKWFIDKGFDSVQIGSETVFVHSGSVRLADVLRTSELAYLKVCRGRVAATGPQVEGQGGAEAK